MQEKDCDSENNGNYSCTKMLLDAENCIRRKFRIFVITYRITLSRYHIIAITCDFFFSTRLSWSKSRAEVAVTSGNSVFPIDKDR